MAVPSVMILHSKLSPSSCDTGSKGFIHVRSQCLAAPPNCGCTLQKRWDRGLKTESFVSNDYNHNITTIIHGRTCFLHYSIQ